MVKTINTNPLRDFIPEWEKNKEQSPAEQIVIVYKAPTVAMKERLVVRQFDFTQPEGSSNKDMRASMSIVIDRNRIIGEMVADIKNLSTIDQDGETKRIKTVKQLFESGLAFDGLVEEIYTFLNEQLNKTELEEKN